MRGDYANLFVTVDSSVEDLLDNLTGAADPRSAARRAQHARVEAARCVTVAHRLGRPRAPAALSVDRGPRPGTT